MGSLFGLAPGRLLLEERGKVAERHDALVAAQRGAHKTIGAWRATAAAGVAEADDFHLLGGRCVAFPVPQPSALVFLGAGLLV